MAIIIFTEVYQGMNNQVSFEGRCPQIKTAYKVCHTINENLPHVSTTKLQPLVDNVARKNIHLYDAYLKTNSLSKNDLFAMCNPEEKKIISIFYGFNNLVRSCNLVRNDHRALFNSDYNKVFSILSQLKFRHLGNCFENANSAVAILKLNGFENACTARLKDSSGRIIDHILCVFNRDGSKVDKVVNNQTIIVDPWAGIVDFANSAIKKYENTMKEQFLVFDNSKISITDIKEINLSNAALENLREMFPQLIFKKGSK